MCDVTKILRRELLKIEIGPTNNPYFVDFLETEDKIQAFNLIWQQIQVDDFFSALNILSDPVSMDSLKIFLLRRLHENIVIGFYSRPKNLKAVEVLCRRRFGALPLQLSESSDEAFGNFLKYLNIIHKHVQDDNEDIDKDEYYLTSLGVFAKEPKLHKAIIFTRKLVARALDMEVIASAFIGKEMHGVAELLKYKEFKVFNREEMLQFGFISREESPIKIMRLKITTKRKINTRRIMKSRFRKNQVAGAVKDLTKLQFTNIRGLKSNINPVRILLETEKPHLLFLTESKIAPPLDVAYLNCQGYSLEHNFKRHAGVCVYVRDDLCCQRLPRYEDASFSTLWLLVETGTHRTIYVGVYKSKSENKESPRFFDHLKEQAELAQHNYPTAELVILGDFNAHHKDWLVQNQTTDRAGREVRKFAECLNLHQLVDLPTRVPDAAGQTPNCLDLLLTTDPDRHYVSVWTPLGSSDHCLVESVSSYSPPDLRPMGQ